MLRNKFGRKEGNSPKRNCTEMLQHVTLHYRAFFFQLLEVKKEIKGF
jgi:hypothetical protein